MKVVGLVTEYNPFHNGHRYHIEEAKRITGADYAIAVMSGNFVQRGTPAVIDKYSRTGMALGNGIDLVLELPVCYATASAEYFAHGAISLLDRLGIVDYVCFGSECGDIGLLREAAQFLSNAPESFDAHVLAGVKNGLTYPAARAKALEDSVSAPHHALTDVLNEPNNILGIEYLKALLQLKSSIQPVTIKRLAAHYHSIDLSGINNPAAKAAPPGRSPHGILTADSPAISSATAIRKAIHGRDENKDGYFNEIRHSVPEEVLRILKEQYLSAYPITEEDFGPIIRYKLLSEDSTSLASYLDISSDLADRLKNIPAYDKDMELLVRELKTKNTTLTRINRILIHILLNIRTRDMDEYNNNGYTGYARVLGIKKEASHLLRKIEAVERIPIITKVTQADRQLDPLSMRMLNTDIFAAHLYNQVVYDKFKTVLPNEYKKGICLL